MPEAWAEGNNIKLKFTLALALTLVIMPDHEPVCRT